MLTLEDDTEFDLGAEYLSRYPGLCINCGSRTCVCPPVPPATVGRVAKELRLDLSARRISDYEVFSAEGAAVARSVFETSGFDPRVARRLPFDRGDLNVALTQLSFRLANALEHSEPTLADRLRAQAVTIGRAERGTASIDGGSENVMGLLREAWVALDTDSREEIRKAEGTSGEMTHLLERRVLVVTANPERESKPALRLDLEFRAIREAFKRTPISVHIEPLLAATIDDFRRTLSEKQFDIIHFAGHADQDGLSLVDEIGNEVSLSYRALAELVARQKNVQVVVLNACHTMDTLEVPFAPLVIGMLDETDDEVALAFTTGFYDAIAIQKGPDEAFDEGIVSVKSRDLDADGIVRLRPKAERG